MKTLLRFAVFSLIFVVGTSRLWAERAARFSHRCGACRAPVYVAPILIGYDRFDRPIFQWQTLAHRCAPRDSYDRSYRHGFDDARRHGVNPDHPSRDRDKSDRVRVFPGRNGR